MCGHNASQRYDGIERQWLQKICGKGLSSRSRNNIRFWLKCAYSPRRWVAPVQSNFSGLFTEEMGLRTKFWHNTSHWRQQVSIGPVTELVSVGQVEKREPPQTGAPGARVAGQSWLHWDCDVKRRRKVPCTTFPANSTAAFAARLAPAAAVRALSS